MAILTLEDGIVAATPQEAQQAEAAGYVKCATSMITGRSLNYGQPCNFYISPETQSELQHMGGYYTCPVCYHSHDFLHEMPWHGVPEEEMSQRDLSGFQAGGGTRIGLGMDVQGQIGEDLVENMGTLGEYGAITWWHQGGAGAQSPLDGATTEWGIEVKTLGYDAMHHRFIPGRPKEKVGKNEMAAKMGKKGVLGVLVLLDYRRSVADIFVREYPIEKGIGTFRTNAAMHLVKEVAFRNPLLDPHDPSPSVANEEMPF